MVLSSTSAPCKAPITFASRMLFVMVLLLGTSGSLWCQWQPEQRLTVDPDSSFTSYSVQRSIAANGSDVRIVWRDNRDGNREIYYKHSVDGGASWFPDVRLTNDPFMSRTPGIAVHVSAVHVVWTDDRDGNDEIYYKRSTDGGTTWGADVRLTTDTAFSNMPGITSTGADVYISFSDRRDGRHQVYFKHSTDGGVSWGPDTKLVTSPGYAYNPSIVAMDSLLHLVWNDTREGAIEVYYKQSRNKGASWSSEICLSEAANYSELPSIAASGTNVHVVWTDSRGGIPVIYHTRSTNNGVQWAQSKNLTPTSVAVLWSSVTCSGEMVHVVWPDDRDGTFDMFYTRSTDAGRSWEQTIRISDNHGTSSGQPSVAVSDSAVHVIWMDMRDGMNGEVYYTKNPTGNSITPTGIGRPAPERFATIQNHPNPVRTHTTINYSVVKAVHMTLTVHDVLGRIVARVVDAWHAAGEYETPFNTSTLPPGIYLCRLTADEFVTNARMVVVQ